MKAMIFAAGLGTRLRPLTDSMPKALVKVGGIPMLERVIIHLRDCGFDRIIVNVHHFGQSIIDFLNENDFGIEIAVSDERDTLLDTGGAIVKAREWLDGDEPFLVHNADILTDLDLGEMMRRHERLGASATLLVSGRQSSRYLLFDDSMRLHGWTNVTTGDCLPVGIDAGRYSRFAFGGIHVISPSLLNRLHAYGGDAPFPIVPFYVKSCAESGIYGYVPEGQCSWFDIGRHSTLEAAESYLSRKETDKK